MDTPIIEKTQDYSIFKSVSFNRNKNKRHIEQLKKIVGLENLLHLHPILVNNNMEVIDGQHRLEAAKDLGLTVYYIKSDVSYQHILNSNLFQKKLSLSDVIKFYALKDGGESYIKLKECLEMLDIHPKALLGLIFGGTTKPLLDFIKSGKFQLPSDQTTTTKMTDSYKKFMEFVYDKRIKPISIFTGADFAIAYRNIVLTNAYNEQTFFNKLDQRWFDLKPQVNSKEWTRQLIAIYNWKNQNPIEGSQ